MELLLPAAGPPEFHEEKQHMDSQTRQWDGTRDFHPPVSEVCPCPLHLCSFSLPLPGLSFLTKYLSQIFEQSNLVPADLNVSCFLSRRKSPERTRQTLNVMPPIYFFLTSPLLPHPPPLPKNKRIPLGSLWGRIFCLALPFHCLFNYILQPHEVWRGYLQKLTS